MYHTHLKILQHSSLVEFELGHNGVSMDPPTAVACRGYCDAGFAACAQDKSRRVLGNGDYRCHLLRYKHVCDLVLIR